jgi:hypothetical protein
MAKTIEELGALAVKNWIVVNLEHYGPRYLAYHNLEEGATLNYGGNGVTASIQFSFDELVKLTQALRAYPAIEEASKPEQPERKDA